MSFLTDTQNELDLLILEDYEFETTCEGQLHHLSEKGHISTESATHFLQCPSCERTVLVCASRATYLRFAPTLLCEACEFQAGPENWTIQRIPGK
jgi:hypothetical protein